MKGKRKFKAPIIQHGKMDAGYVKIPFSVETVYGTKGNVKVKAFFDGVEYRGSIANMGLGGHTLGVTKAIRKSINKSFGEVVDVEIELDTEERIVEVPEALKEWFRNNPMEQSFFDSLSYTNRKEYARWIKEAKKEETRNKRLGATFEKLKKGKRNPFEK